MDRRDTRTELGESFLPNGHTRTHVVPPLHPVGRWMGVHEAVKVQVHSLHYGGGVQRTAQLHLRLGDICR